MKTIPVDLILYDLGTLLIEAGREQLARDLCIAVNPQSLAEQWSVEPVPTCTNWLFRRLIGDAEGSSSYASTGVAVARRLADVALSRCVTGTKDDFTTARTLLQAAQTIVGLSVETAPSGEECSEERARMAVEMATEMPMRSNVVQSGLKVEARNGAITFTAPPTTPDQIQTTEKQNTDVWHTRWAERNAEANTQAETLNKIARAVNWDRTGDLADAVQSMSDAHRRDFEALSNALPLAAKPFMVGDKVRIVRQYGRVWVSEMDKTIGKVGRITFIDPDDDMRVVFEDKNDWWWYAPQSLEHAD